MSEPLSPEPVSPIDDALIDRALARSESIVFDCKRLKGKAATVLECIVAFANTEGGTIALGLEDPGKDEGRRRVYGLQEDRAAWDELRRLIRSRITDPDDLTVDVAEVGCTLRDGSRGTVAFITVQKGRVVHSIVGDGTFVRLDKGNRQLTAREINELSFQRGVVSAERQLEDVDFELLDTDYWRAYARKRRLTRPIAEAMFHLGLAKRSAGDLRPTRAAVLLFAEDPSGLLAGKAAVRIFHYRGERVATDPNTNLSGPPITISGPLSQIIAEARDAVVRQITSGIQMGPLGFEIVQRYPLRVISEAITNAVIHRDYRLPTDVLIRIFVDRIEVESPGLLVGPVTVSNISRIGSQPRNPLIVSHLREFPMPPNLDAGEGVPMMFGTMREAGLYPPQYWTRPRLDREAVRVYLFNERRPSVWEQVSDYVSKHGSVGNAEIRQLMNTDDTLRATRQLKEWVDLGLLVVANPGDGKRSRRYAKPDTDQSPLFFR